MKRCCLHLLAMLLSTVCLPAFATTFTLDQVTDVVAPSTRGNANTTWFGWETFDDTNPIDDTTPDIGTTTTGANFKTINGENHRSGSGNIYFMTRGYTLAEQVTVPTSGTVGTTGTTTIIAQFVTAFGDFPTDTIYLSTINGIQPKVVRAVNAAGKGQVWARWQVPGNAASYAFTIGAPAGVVSFSIDRLVVDTHWDATTPQPDVARTTQPMSLATGLYTPSFRGASNTTWFGWDLFNDAGHDAEPINDSTPDIGTTATGVNFQTTNGEDHISGSRNFYTAGGTLAEQVTVATTGTPGTGFTTIIAQAVALFGNYPGNMVFSSIAGVAPTVVQTTNGTGSGQVWAIWKIPGNAASYTFTVTAPAGVGPFSIDKFVVDTFWNASAYAGDNVISSTPAQSLAMDALTDSVAPAFRGTANTTFFGWETWNDTGHFSEPIDDSTPDINAAGAPAGVRFHTNIGDHTDPTNFYDHVSGTGKFFISAADRPVDETVTVVTSGTPGTDGTTTIIAQIVSQVSFFPGALSFSSIEGVAPVIVNGVNVNSRAQVWVKWVVPGNKASYTFTITAPAGASNPAPYSFDRLVIDTVWTPSGQAPADTMTATTPAIASVMHQISDLVPVSSRGRANSTWFGWDNFNDGNNRANPTPINDSTPDIGTTTTGASFQTTNGEDHLTDGGNLYSSTLTLAEQITVPTQGTVGSSGFTTIIVQIMSASNGPDSHFSDVINLSSINGVAPVIVQDANSLVLGQLYAVYKIPGNQASYTINISGPAQHYSFDRVMVDTFFSTAGYLADSMALDAPAISTASPLAVAAQNAALSLQLAASGGTAPYAWTTTAGSLPAGVTLSATGLLSGTPTDTGTSNFTVKLTDANGLTVTKDFGLTITTVPSITSASQFPESLVGAPFSFTFTADGGTAPYTWTLDSGTLPAGLTLEAGGTLTGTPTAPGTSIFGLKVTDANGLVGTAQFALKLNSLTITSATALTPAVKGVAYSQALTSTGGTQPHTWSLAAGSVLPAGLTLSSAGAITGKATVAGTFTFTIKATDGGAGAFAVTKDFSLTITATYVKPVMNPATLGTTTVGVPFSYSLSAQNYPKTFVVTGLPSGIMYNATTGIISGRPTVSGVFNVKLSARNTAGTSAIVTVPLTVKALPNTLLGSFAGLVARDGAANNNLGSLLSLTTTATGSFTAKVTTGAVARSATGFLAATAPQVVITLDGKPLSLTLANNLVSGIFGSASVNGWRSTWNAQLNPATHRIGYYSFALELDSQDTTLPQGYGYGTFSVAAAGTLVIAGKTADGSAIATSTFLGPNGEIAVYGGLGAVIGKLILAEDSNQEFAGNTLTGALSWKKAATTGRTYAAAFGPVNLNAAGGYLAPNTVGEVLGLPDAGTADVKFTEGGIDASATEADVTDFTYTDNNAVIMPVGPNNQAKATLSIAKGTGAVSGKFTLVETTPALTRANIAFQGQTVRLSDGAVKAVGYFLLPQIPVAPQTAATAPILSGAFTIEPSQP